MDRITHATSTTRNLQTQHTHNAELKGTNRQPNCEDDDAASQVPTGTRLGMHMANAPHYRPLGRRTASATLQIPHTKQRHMLTAHRYAQTAQRTARSQSCGLSTGTYGYQTRHTHGRCDPPPGLPGRRSASAAQLLPHTEQTRVPRAGHAAWLCCLPLMSLMASVRLSLPTLTHMYTLVYIILFK